MSLSNLLRAFGQAALRRSEGLGRYGLSRSGGPAKEKPLNGYHERQWLTIAVEGRVGNFRAKPSGSSGALP
jgi:hypothetical protein